MDALPARSRSGDVLGEDRRGETRWSTESLRRLEATALVRAEIGAEDRAHALAPEQIQPSWTPGPP